jgi:hypothetical protein
LGALIAVASVKAHLEFPGNLFAVPVAVLPYVLVYLMNRSAHNRAADWALLGVSVAFAGTSVLANYPSTDAQGGLIVIVAPAAQLLAAIGTYLFLRFTDSLAPSGTGQ